jgi:hypothetical protein
LGCSFVLMDANRFSFRSHIFLFSIFYQCQTQSFSHSRCSVRMGWIKSRPPGNWQIQLEEIIVLNLSPVILYIPLLSFESVEVFCFCFDLFFRLFLGFWTSNFSYPAYILEKSYLEQRIILTVKCYSCCFSLIGFFNCLSPFFHY